MQQSVKAEDPFKVGKFGIGFNSVYHITGMLLWDPLDKGTVAPLALRHSQCGSAT